MNLSMAVQRTLPPKTAEVVVFKPSRVVRQNDGHVKINQMAVVWGVPLCETHPVGIMTGGTRRFLVYNMFPVYKALIVQQN